MKLYRLVTNGLEKKNIETEEKIEKVVRHYSKDASGKKFILYKNEEGGFYKMDENGKKEDVDPEKLTDKIYKE